MFCIRSKSKLFTAIPKRMYLTDGSRGGQKRNRGEGLPGLDLFAYPLQTQFTKMIFKKKSLQTFLSISISGG